MPEPSKRVATAKEWDAVYSVLKKWDTPGDTFYHEYKEAVNDILAALGIRVGEDC